MNEKLKAFQGKISQHIKTRKTGKDPNGCLVNITAWSNDKEKHDYIRISFHRRILHLTGWIPGDKLDVEISGNNAMVFRSPSGRTLGKLKEVGTTRPPVKFCVPYKSTLGLPTGAATNVEATAGCVAFVWPEED